MKSKYLFISLTLIAFLFFQCHKSLSYIGSPDTGITVNPDPITANVQGNIIDENNQPAAGVAITNCWYKYGNYRCKWFFSYQQCIT